MRGGLVINTVILIRMSPGIERKCWGFSVTVCFV